MECLRVVEENQVSEWREKGLQPVLTQSKERKVMCDLLELTS